MGCMCKYSPHSISGSLLLTHRILLPSVGKIQVKHDTCRHHCNWPYYLPRHSLFLLNCFQTGQGSCHAILHKWGLAISPTCDSGQQQTMSHIVYVCPLTKFHVRLQLLYKAENDAVNWLESTATTAFMKCNENANCQKTNESRTLWHSWVTGGRCICHILLEWLNYTTVWCWRHHVHELL